MDSDQIAQHYSQGTILKGIESALDETLGSDRSLTIDDISMVDEFHIGGRRATVRLCERLGLQPGLRVLDIGAGIGGAARYVAKTYQCKVDGIDRTPEFCEVAEHLTGRVGLSDWVSVQYGDATSLPFDDDTFNAAYMIHVGMNIADKASVYAEIARVLRPGTLLAIYDVLRGANPEELRFPLPWASTPTSNFLATPDEMADLLEHAGFRVESKEDRTSFAREFFAAQKAAQPAGAVPPLGLHLLMGEGAPIKYGNMIEGVSGGLCGPWEFIARKAA